MIVVLEDSETFSGFLKSILEKEGYEVKIASSGEAGLTLIEKAENIELMLVDYRLGDMTGIEVLKKTQAILGQNPKTLMISSTDRDEIKAEAKALGVLGWMVKPCEPEKLRQILNHVLKSA